LIANKIRPPSFPSKGTRVLGVYVLKSTVGGCDFGIHEYPALNSLGVVVGFDVEGKMMRCTE
jgi:hypothetical protein